VGKGRATGSFRRLPGAYWLRLPSCDFNASIDNASTRLTRQCSTSSTAASVHSVRRCALRDIAAVVCVHRCALTSLSGLCPRCSAEPLAAAALRPRMPKMHRYLLCAAAVVACVAARRRPGSRIVQFTKRLPRRTRRAAETVVLDMPLGLLESRVERQLSKALGQAPVEHGAFQALRMVCGFALLFQSAKIPQTAATLQCFACLLQISHGLILGATGGGIDLFQSPARDDEGARVLFGAPRLDGRDRGRDDWSSGGEASRGNLRPR
jgi:hypothetical protein